MRTAVLCLLGALGAVPLSLGCDDDTVPLPDGGADAGVPVEVPLDPESPWPKFRQNALQNGRADVEPVDNGSDPWTFQTGKGIFSSPVIDGEGNIYIGSADRKFYKLSPEGAELWSVLTGEIIDSSALLDDLGRVYFGSGDGHVYALDRETGEERWRFQADDPSVNEAFIRWFEGNVAIGPGGTLYAPNDNFCTYALDRETGDKLWCFETPDQTWSLPAVNTATGRLFLGNNFLVGSNVYAVDAADGRRLWGAGTGATVAASPLLTGTGPDDLVVVGSFSGALYAYQQSSPREIWSLGFRDHVYSSPAAAEDGTLIQPVADGTIYAVDPADGSVVWAFDTREPVRSSPAIDGDGNIYVGSGEGRLFVLNPDGTLRWSMRLIDEPRDDLNASPALGHEGVVVAGENGGVFYVPYDYCLRPSLDDPRCTLGPAEDLPDEGAHLFYTSRFGRLEDPAPDEIDANQPLTFALFVRDGGDTTLALIDSGSVEVTVTPDVPTQVDVSGDRKFIALVPDAAWASEAGGTLTVRLRGDYLVGFDRVGLRFTGGEVGGSFDQTFSFDVRARSSVLALPFPAAPGDDAALWELYRIAAPMPTILPSYNQIGFDSIHYLVGVVEGTEEHAIAWGIGAIPSGDDNETVVDPASEVRFALELEHDEGLLTFFNRDGFTISFNGFPLPFEFFRVATRVDAQGVALESAAMNGRVVCGDIDFYGTFMQSLGFCNPTTDELVAFGGAELRPHGDGVQSSPGGLGTVAFAATSTSVTASYTGTTLRVGEHNFGVLLVDTSTGRPVVADYVGATVVTAATGGLVDEVALTLEAGAAPAEVRAYAMVDAYPAAVQALVIP